MKNGTSSPLPECLIRNCEKCSTCLDYWQMGGCRAKDEHSLELDFGALDFSLPKLTLSSSIGNGTNFISKVLGSRLGGSSESARALLEHLLAMNYHGEV